MEVSRKLNVTGNPFALNGMFHSTGRFRSRIGLLILAAGWLLFVASFALPATDVAELPGTPPGTPLNGWQAMSSGVLSVFYFPLILVAEPRTLLLLLLPVLNLGIFVCPVLLMYADEEDAPLFGTFMLICGVSISLLPWNLVGNLYYGFYCWTGSILVMALGYFVLGVMARLRSRRLIGDLCFDRELALRRAMQWSPPPVRVRR